MALERIAEEKFAQLMGRVLSPSRAIESPELLKGRDDQLREIRRAWYQGGRQIFIYGYRVVYPQSYSTDLDGLTCKTPLVVGARGVAA